LVLGGAGHTVFFVFCSTLAIQPLTTDGVRMWSINEKSPLKDILL